MTCCNICFFNIYLFERCNCEHNSSLCWFLQRLLSIPYYLATIAWRKFRFWRHFSYSVTLSARRGKEVSGPLYNLQHRTTHTCIQYIHTIYSLAGPCIRRVMHLRFETLSYQPRSAKSVCTLYDVSPYGIRPIKLERYSSRKTVGLAVSDSAWLRRCEDE